MRQIQFYTIEVGTQGNGFIRLKLADGTEIPSIPFTQIQNFSAVCAMLAHTRVFYEVVNGVHKFISTNEP